MRIGRICAVLDDEPFLHPGKMATAYQHYFQKGKTENGGGARRIFKVHGAWMVRRCYSFKYEA